MERGQIENSINRFITSFDTRNWRVMAATLSDEIFTDYADLRGEPAALTSKSDYIELRRAAHDHTRTHHLLTNLVVTIDSDKAAVEASCMIYRNSDGISFNSHALYHFELIRRAGEWVITVIRQNILWNDGDPGIHRGVPADKQ